MPDNNQTNNNRKKRKLTIRLLLIVGALLIANVFACYYHIQTDLTRGQRYSITPATKKMLRQLDKPVFVTVYLNGNDLPAAYKKLSNSTRELLRSFRDISNNKVDFRFVDPLGNDTTVTKALEDFQMSGFPVTLPNGKKGMKQEMIFPWALVVVDGKPWPVMLQESNSPRLSAALLEKSDALLEYNIATAIHQLSKSTKDTIAYITGNNEASRDEIISAIYYLLRFYSVDTFNINQSNAIPSKYKAIIINRPMAAFTDMQKFRIDQYLMHGGNIFLGINAVPGNLDSFRNDAGKYNALPLDLNISDLLFHYGARINTDLVRDADNCIELPLSAPDDNTEPPTYPWQYYPILHPPADAASPIVKNLNEVLGKFVSSIDTNGNDRNIQKTVLLTTSKYTMTEPTPEPIMLASVADPVNRASYTSANRIAAVLLEGPFHSFYTNHLPEDVKSYLDSLHINIKQQAPQSGKIVVVSDGDLILNETTSDGTPMDMGMVPFSMYHFENKAFLLNCMEYLTDPDNLLEARTKSFEPQLLDATRVQDEKSKWQLINIGIPALLVLIFGAVYLFIRKKRYA